MAKELIINASLPEIRIALLEDGRIQELLIERESEKGIVGNIYKGKVTRVLPGMQAAFVDIGLDKAAFLYVDDIYVHPKVMGEETEMEEESDAQGMSSPESESSTETNFEASSEEANQNASTSDQSSSVEMSDAIADEIADSEDFSSEAGEEALEAAESFEDESFDLAEEANEESEANFSESGIETDAQSETEGYSAQEAADLNSDINSDINSDTNSEINSEIGNEAPAEAGAESTATNSEEAGSMQGLVQPQRDRGGRRGRNRHRNRRGGRNKNRFAGGESHEDPNMIPESMTEQLADQGNVESDRAAVAGEGIIKTTSSVGPKPRQRPEFREPRGRDRRIKSKNIKPRAQANIADLLSEGQEVIVQVAKDPIATKGARLTCHVSLPGRHLVCMPSIDHVGVSRRIERDDERRRLRDFVEKNRPKKMGFIVRTASGGKDPESWIKQDIDYLSKLWKGIRTRADNAPPASLVYEDLNSVLRAIRDWVNEDISKIVVDSRYHYNELLEFAERFMPSLEGKIELYQGDIPIFDAYSLSAELNRSLERKVWLKSGGYIVIDQAEALVAIDVNTGRFVGKTNLEATILKTNIEAAEEIAYQMRLRNCGGMIIIDFIDMEREDNKMRVYRAFDEALKKDRARPTIQKISELGLVEMTRKRTRDTLVRSLCEPCTHCEGKGYTKGARTVAYEILREVERLGVDRDAKKILISAHESVVDLLAIDLRDVLDTLEKRYNKQVYIQAILDFHNEQFEVVTDRMQGRKQSADIARQLRMERDRSERKEKQKNRQKDSAREREDRSDRDDREEQAPKPKPSGSFIVKPKPAATSEMEPMVDGVDTSPDMDMVNTGDAAVDSLGDESQPPQMQMMQPRQNPSVSKQPNYKAMNTADMDEDQLAYLRAQAAQDAAIASLTQDGVPGQKSQQQNRGRHQNNRNQRNNGGGGHNRNNRNRHQNNRHQRFRPQGGNGNTMNAGASHEQPASSAPDYDVVSKPEGDGSES